ncbi:MAG TPA: DNA-3-methyladenine glycosylase I [Exilispira sp.]|nr:DNA-3-methyladenine glycosylase I [Exilispira sp.]
MDEKMRCPWAGNDPIYVNYHDKEWGVPVFDDKTLFEMLILDGFQAGLSWITILKKRDNFRIAFDYFDPYKIAQYDDIKKNQLMQNPLIIRNKLKIEAAINNARQYIRIIESKGSFSNYIWDFVDGRPIVNKWKEVRQIPTSTKYSDKMSIQMKKDGFSFVGTTICYAFMQAAGLVNDHLICCFRYDEILKLY